MAQHGLDRVGLAGLGTMGLPIARRLLATGIEELLPPSAA